MGNAVQANGAPTRRYREEILVSGVETSRWDVCLGWVAGMK